MAGERTHSQRNYGVTNRHPLLDGTLPFFLFAFYGTAFPPTAHPTSSIPSIMARRSATPSASAATTTATAPATASSAAAATTVSSAAATKATSSSSLSSSRTFDSVVHSLLQNYEKATPQRTKLLDAFMAFLLVVGALQFVYCVLAGNYVRRPTRRIDLWLPKPRLQPTANLARSPSTPSCPASRRPSDSLS